MDPAETIQIVLPWNGGCKLEQLFKAENRLFAQKKKHPVGRAQAQIGPEAVGQLAGKTGAALFGPGGVAQPFQFIGDNAFQPEGGGSQKGIRHGLSLLNSD